MGFFPEFAFPSFVPLESVSLSSVPIQFLFIRAGTLGLTGELFFEVSRLYPPGGGLKTPVISLTSFILVAATWSCLYLPC